MKRFVVLASALALAACGGGNSKPDTSIRSFNYGAATPATSTQQSAVGSAHGDVKDMSAAVASSTSITGASSAPEFADGLAAEVLPNAAVAALPNDLLARLPGWDGTRLSANGLYAAKSSALSSTGNACVTTTATSITYANCTQSTDGFSGTVNGSISVVAGVITWDLTYKFTGSSGSGSFDGSFYWTGKFTVTSTSFAGFGRTAADFKYSGNGQNAEVQYVAGVDANLTFNADCITGGTLEVRRQYRVSGSQSANGDAAAKFTWAAGSTCPSTPTVQTGT